MENLKSFAIFLAVTVLTLVIGCNGTTGPAGPTGPSGPSFTGNTSGLITITDTDGTQLTNRSGVKVWAEGQNDTVFTSASGQWQINGLTTGTYTIDYVLSGFGSSKTQNFQFVGGSTTYLGNIFMSQNPNFTVSLNTTPGSGNGYVNIMGSVSGFAPSGQTNGRNILMFVGTSSSVSSQPSQNLGVLDAYCWYDSTTFTDKVLNSTFNGFGIGYGSTVYIIAYAASAPLANCTRYVDVTTGRFFYTSLGAASNVITLTTPDGPVTGHNTGISRKY